MTKPFKVSPKPSLQLQGKLFDNCRYSLQLVYGCFNSTFSNVSSSGKSRAETSCDFWGTQISSMGPKFSSHRLQYLDPWMQGAWVIIKGKPMSTTLGSAAYVHCDFRPRVELFAGPIRTGCTMKFCRPNLRHLLVLL